MSRFVIVSLEMSLVTESVFCAIALTTCSNSSALKGMGCSSSWSRNPTVSPRLIVTSSGEELSTTTRQVL